MPSLPKQLETTPTPQEGEKLIVIAPPEDGNIGDLVGRAFNHKAIGRAYTINDNDTVTVAVGEGKNLSKVSQELGGAAVTELEPAATNGNGSGSSASGENLVAGFSTGQVAVGVGAVLGVGLLASQL